MNSHRVMPKEDNSLFDIISLDARKGRRFPKNGVILSLNEGRTSARILPKIKDTFSTIFPTEVHISRVVDFVEGFLDEVYKGLPFCHRNGKVSFMDDEILMEIPLA